MARQRRGLDDQLADLMTQARGTRTNSFTTPAMAAIGPGMIEDRAIFKEHMAPRAVGLENLDDDMRANLAALAEGKAEIEEATARLDAEQARLDSLFEEVGAVPAQILAAQAAAEAAAKAYTDANASGGVSPEELAALRQDAQDKADAAKAAAIAAAAADATVKADKALADAKADATNKADQAEADAIAAAAGDATTKMNNVANSKNATFYGTATPTATAPKGGLAGDTYRRRNTAGNIIGEWEWSGTAWTQRKMTSESMTAVDVGVLTAGSAVIQDAVAQKIAASTASFQKADIGNLTVTGSSKLNDAVIQKLYTDVVLSREVIADKVKAGAIDGLRIIGASIETSAKADEGVKLTDAGLSAHGKGTSRANGRTYSTRASITSQRSSWSDETNATDTWPGLWFSSAEDSGPMFVPYAPAGFAAGEADSQEVYMRSAMTTNLSGHSIVRATPSYSSMEVVSARTATSAPGNSTTVYVEPDRFRLESTKPGIGTLAGVRHDGDGNVALTGMGGVSVRHGIAGRTSRVPIGLLDRWESRARIEIRKDTAIATRVISVPPRANIRVNVILRGYPNADDQWLQIWAAADNAGFGDGTHYSRKMSMGQDCRMSFIYKSTDNYAKNVSFRVVGNVVQSSVYVIPASSDHLSTAEINFEDLGDY